ncbi:GRB2-associated-binding protein 1 isoform X2 [Rhincodon typus]|uniref:GRB2-associated-binding protein 1 isoform X2 n=1 Tax=Rhincodon typus TaxID=259920 RepID=UPI0009A2B0BA|nr:GRB2-associated-binding protein 1 isoform X2 [Rhincodon typus]
MSGGDIVYNGWLRKSPPEKKLRRYAWKKRWFVLRSGRLTGDPDVLEYYKNDHAKKPIRVIDLNLCEQVDAGLTFNKKDLENSYIFDIRTIDRVFYLVADTEEEMNKWVRCICDICGFNPTDEDAVKSTNPSGNVSTEVPLSVQPSERPAVSIGSLPPPYQPISVRHLESLSSQEDPQDYLWLANCESKKPEPASQASSFATEEGDEYLLLEDFESKKHPFHKQFHADSLTKSTSSETDCNDNVPSHKPPAPPASKQAINGFFSQQSFYDSPPPRITSTSTDSSLYNLPRSYSQDLIAGTCSPLIADSEGDSHVFNAPSRISILENQMRQMSVCYDIPSTPGGTYQIPRPSMEGTLSQSCSKLEPIPDVPPPRPPKPSLSHDRSPVDTYCVPRSSSEADTNYSVPTSGKTLRSNTIGTVEGHWLRKDCGPQDSYDIPRTFSNSVDLGEGFSSYLQKKGMMPLASLCNEEADQNYVPMDANSPPRLQTVSHSEPIQDTNYVAMTPGPFDFPALGMQVPPPAHMGFRVSPKTPPRRPVPTADCQPPPVDRNLKPDRKGQSPKILRAKPVLERTDTQTIGDFTPRRHKVKPAPLEIKPLPEFEELQELAPVRSPVTKTFTREISLSRFPANPRPASVHSTASSTDSQEDSEENYVAMEPAPSTDDPTVKQGSLQSCDGGSSLTRSKGDKQQVEYLDLDLDSGKSTPPRKKSNGTGTVTADEKVDYVLVDQERTLALKNTRKAWTDERQSTESETPVKSAK